MASYDVLVHMCTCMNEHFAHLPAQGLVCKLIVFCNCVIIQ